MSLIGKLVKEGLKLNQAIQFGKGKAEDLQREQLISLLEQARSTAFGTYYGFDELLDKEDVIKAFQKRIPFFNYATMNEAWWSQQQKLPDISWPGKPDYFALTSGTTGKSSKRIPITDAFSQSMKSVGTSMIETIPNFDFPEEIYESEILMLSSSARLKQNEQGFLEGEISGINVSNFPDWYDVFYRPGKEIAEISDWDMRVQRIAEEAPNWNIGAIAGIPSWVLPMLKKVIEVNGAETIHDVWPNLTVFASGGVAFETYRKDFEAICEKELTIMDTYLASEGFFAFTARPHTLSMKLALNHGYFYEFIPFDERGVDENGDLLDDPVVHTISEVEPDQEYVLIVTTCAGAWRYQIGDVIKFTSLEPHEIVITGRTKFFLNVVGSQLSEEKLDSAILDVSEQLGISVNEYSVAAIKNDSNEYIHQWIVVSESKPEEERFAELLDQSLKDSNNNYAVARTKALKEVRVISIDKTTYHEYLEHGKKKGGQVKTPKVMSGEKMNEYLTFIKQDS